MSVEFEKELLLRRIDHVIESIHFRIGDVVIESDHINHGSYLILNITARILNDFHKICTILIHKKNPILYSSIDVYDDELFKHTYDLIIQYLDRNKKDDRSRIINQLRYKYVA